MLDRIQYRMAEAVFRPIHVFRICYREGQRMASAYGWAVFILGMAVIGFGAMLKWGVSDPRFFSFDAEPSLIGYFGYFMIFVWIAAGFYLVFVLSLISLASIAHRIRSLF